MNNSEQRNRKTRAKPKTRRAGPKGPAGRREDAMARQARTSRALAAINSGPRACPSSSVARNSQSAVSRVSKLGFSPGLTGFGRVCPALTGYNFEQQRCRPMVGTSRGDVPARVPAAERQAKRVRLVNSFRRLTLRFRLRSEASARQAATGTAQRAHPYRRGGASRQCPWSAAVPGRSKPRIFEHVGKYPGGCTSDVAAPETGALQQ